MGFLDSLKTAILLREGSLTTAAQKIGMSKTALVRRLTGEYRLSVQELLSIADALAINICDLLEETGHSRSPLPSWQSLLAPLQQDAAPNPDFLVLAERIPRLLSDPPPEGGYSLDPSNDFYSLLRKQDRDRPGFRREVLIRASHLRAQFIKKRRYRASDLQTFVEVLDLYARASEPNIPTAVAHLRLALMMPVKATSLTGLYLAEFASKLLASEKPAVAFAYLLPTLSLSFLSDSTVTARLLFIFADLAYRQGDAVAALKAHQRILTLNDLKDSSFHDHARFFLANYSAQTGDLQKALDHLQHLPDSAYEHPQLTFNVYWLGGKVRVLRNDHSGAIMMLAALEHKPEQQKPLHLVLLLEDLIPYVPQETITREAKRIQPHLRRVRSDHAKKILERFVSRLIHGKEPGPPLTDQIQDSSHNS